MSHSLVNALQDSGCVDPNVRVGCTQSNCSKESVKLLLARHRKSSQVKNR